MTASAYDSESRRADALRLALGWFAAPLAWALHLGAGYALAGWVCDHGTRWALHALTAVCLLIAAAGIAANGYRGERAAAQPADSAAAHGAARFLRDSGRLLGVLFFVLIAVESIPILLAGYCA